MPTHSAAHAALPRPVAQLFGDLTREAADLVHAELGEKLERARSGLQTMAAAGLLAAGGVVLVLTALARLLAAVLPPAWAAWLAPLLVGALALLAAWWLYRRSRRSLDPQQLAPRHTIDTLGDDRRGSPHRQGDDPARAAEGQDAAAQLFERHPLLLGGLGVVLGGMRSALQPQEGGGASRVSAAGLREGGLPGGTAALVHAGVDEAEELVKDMTEVASDAAERLLHGEGLDGADAVVGATRPRTGG
jgi:hypothetical protein